MKRTRIVFMMTLTSAFQKNWFYLLWERYFSCCTLLTNQIPSFIVWLPLLLVVLGNMCNVIISFPVDDFMNFEINLSFQMNPVSYMTKKFEQKFNISRTRELVSEVKKNSSFLKGFQLPEIDSDMGVGL